MKKSIGKMAISLVLFVCFVLWGSISGAVVAEAKYTVSSLGTLGGGTYSKAYDINDSGWIVGEGNFSSDSGSGIRGFLWKKETGMINLGALGTKSLARGINNAGKVVGYTQPPSAPRVAFTWTDAEGMKELPLSGPDSEGWAINDSDAIAGYGMNVNGQERGFRWAGTLENDLGTLGGDVSQAYGINNLGTVVGYSMNASGNARAFLWDGSMMNPLAILDDEQDSFANRINNHNQVVGKIVQYVIDSDGYYSFSGAQPFLWENGAMRGLGTLGGNDGEALGINDAGAVVGWSTIGEESRAFIWGKTNETVAMVNLNDLIPGDSGWVLTVATAINNQGQIVGYGFQNGIEQAFLLTPIAQEDPEDRVRAFEVKIDIHPWNSQNKIHKQAWWGLVQIAILSDTGFDAPKVVDRESITFGRTGDEDSLAFCMSWKTDVNRDRKKDLICYFYERPTGFECGDTLGTLKGKTLKGEAFGGQDKVQVFPCPTPRKDHKGR
jgi:probable HAF family extracellular repeat protein